MDRIGKGGDKTILGQYKVRTPMCLSVCLSINLSI